jgi:hypothetical protein
MRRGADDRWDPEMDQVNVADYFAKRDGKEFDFIEDFWKRESGFSARDREQ